MLSVSCPHLGSGKVAAQFPLFIRVSHLRPLTDSVISVGQTHVDGDQRPIL